MATPEGKVKELLRKELAKVKVHNFTEAVSIIKEEGGLINGYYFMPQATGQGEAGVSDFVMCILGQYMEVEVKAEGGEHSKIQQLHCSVIHNSLGDYFLVEGDDEVHMFIDHLKDIISGLQTAYMAANQIKELINKPHLRKEDIN